MRKVLVVGATSAIAQATSRRLAGEGAAFFLIARDQEKLAAVSDDLALRGAAEVTSWVMDVLEYDRHEAGVEEAWRALNGFDCVLMAHGSLPDQKACELSSARTRTELEVNAIAAMSLLTIIGAYLESAKAGHILVISSVAGDRGRQSNYVYGAAKGALTVFLQGLRNRLYRAGVTVTTIKPGFVDTPMTEKFVKGPLWASPEKVADDIVASLGSGRDVVYSPWFWRWIMLAIRVIPERLFKRLSL